jgi:hypothetical protein
MRPNIENEDFLQREIIDVAGKQYEALYEKKRDVIKLKELVESLSKPHNVKHVSLTPKTNVFYVLMKPEPDTIERDVEKLLRFVKEKLKESSFAA